MEDKAKAPARATWEMQLWFPADPRHVRLASLVHAFDAWDQVQLIEQPAEPGARMRLVTRAGEVRTGYALFRHLVRSLRLLWPLALWTWLPGVGRLAERRYPS